MGTQKIDALKRLRTFTVCLRHWYGGSSDLIFVNYTINYDEIGNVSGLTANSVESGTFGNSNRFEISISPSIN